MEAKTSQLSVVLMNNIIHALPAGSISEQLILERHFRVIRLIAESGYKAVLYNSLDLEPPSLDLVELQHKLNAELHKNGVKLAVVVPATRFAYLARLAFGNMDCQVFYGNVNDALRWLCHAPNEGKHKEKLLVADVPEAIPALTNALGQYFHILPCTSWAGACSVIRQGVDLVLCGIGFEESKMFDLLEYLRSHEATRLIPFFCIKSTRQKLPSTINDGIEIALRAKGTAGYIDFEGWQSRLGEHHASSILRKKILEALSASNKSGLH
jgi:PleD family two-component response regulator